MMFFKSRLRVSPTSIESGMSTPAPLVTFVSRISADNCDRLPLTTGIEKVPSLIVKSRFWFVAFFSALKTVL